MKKIEIIDDIIDYLNLNVNWDGFDDYPPSIDCILKTIRLVGLMEMVVTNKMTDYSPNPHGTVSLEFNNNIFVEIGDELFTWYKTENGVITIKRDSFQMNEDNINELFNKIKETT